MLVSLPREAALTGLGVFTLAYGVYNFSGEGSFATSGGRVVVYRGNASVQTFAAPSGTGRWWQVFSFDCQDGTISTINVIAMAGGIGLTTFLNHRAASSMRWKAFSKLLP